MDLLFQEIETYNTRLFKEEKNGQVTYILRLASVVATGKISYFSFTICHYFFFLESPLTFVSLCNQIVTSEIRKYTFCCSFYEKIRIHLRETATNFAKIHSLARKYKHLRINQIQLRFLHFNQHSITLLGIHMHHWAYKREKYSFSNANIKVINTILKVKRDN